MDQIKQLKMMRTRQAYFSAVAEEYASLRDFINAQHRWLAIMGISLIYSEDCIKLKIHTGSETYEEYHLVYDSGGFVTVSDLVRVNGGILIDLTTAIMNKTNFKTI
ncbi:MAG: hypothetical protein K2G07_07285 [Muribaculaceae bacterium]|nr:hypothetical protein [Muribaculaceae bacterium]